MKTTTYTNDGLVTLDYEKHLSHPDNTTFIGEADIAELQQDFLYRSPSNRSDKVLHLRERAARYRAQDPAFARWAKGYGMINHSDVTQVHTYELACRLVETGAVPSRKMVYDILWATDRLCSAAMWLVVHQTYASKVYTDGRTLAKEDFKVTPEGHTGGSLNMVPAYTGYLAVNALTSKTRGWLMGPGHCVSAIDSANLLVDNMSPAHEGRYHMNDDALTQFVTDFYNYGVRPDGYPQSPLGSHVNAHTAGGVSEGGYLGFAELQYMHMPLPGESMVAFLSDGAFEEQRGSDFASRWWRAEDSGVVVPILIANGRRIDQRSAIYQNGGIDWLKQHLRLNGFDPVAIDGRDPASYVWGIFHMEDRVDVMGRALKEGHLHYPVQIPHGIAEAPKGFGFPGQATNAAHNLPLVNSPYSDKDAMAAFNEGAGRLFVPKDTLKTVIRILNNHHESGREKERDNCIAKRHVRLPRLPEVSKKDNQAATSPMAAIDKYFCRLVNKNPSLRVRVGNPDEIRSNRLNDTLDMLKHRVNVAEPGTAEDVHGRVITALNEEAVACAALGNKGGLNLVATYEAFGVKMLGAARQELIFARHQREVGTRPGWLSVPFIMTSHTWENGKNEQSHQDPTFCEAMLGEMNDVSRVVFVADNNTATAALREVYRTRGQIWTLVVSKGKVAHMFTAEQADDLMRDGAIRLRGTGEEAVVLTAIGSYQLQETLKASDRLAERGVANSVVYMAEPGRFRDPRDEREAAVMADAELLDNLYPKGGTTRVFVSHTRREAMLAMAEHVRGPGVEQAMLGYINRGGTLDVNGMLFANRCTWAHIVAKVGNMVGFPMAKLLTSTERAAAEGKGSASAIIG